MMSKPTIDQAEHPHGLGGRVMGHLMAWLNDDMNRHVLEQLDVRPGQRVLEVGFGPGRTLERLAQRQTLVCGVDPSATMRSQASARNRAALRAGAMELHQGTASALPYPDAYFDRACAINCYLFFADPDADLRELRRVLRADGRLVLGLRAREGGRGPFHRMGLTREELTSEVDRVERVGFSVRLDVTPVRFMTAACLIADCTQR